MVLRKHEQQKVARHKIREGKFWCQILRLKGNGISFSEEKKSC